MALNYLIARCFIMTDEKKNFDVCLLTGHSRFHSQISHVQDPRYSSVSLSMSGIFSTCFIIILGMNN